MELEVAFSDKRVFAGEVFQFDREQFANCSRKVGKLPIQKIYISGKTEVHLTCSKCGKIKTVPVSKVRCIHRPVGVKCGCGHAFRVVFEKRAYYRKKTHLYGAFTGIAPSGCQGQMIVENLSRSGLCFKTLEQTDIKVGDLVSVEFTLDDPNCSIIKSLAEVKNVRSQYIGAEFYCLDEQSKKSLGFYFIK